MMVILGRFLLLLTTNILSKSVEFTGPVSTNKMSAVLFPEMTCVVPGALTEMQAAGTLHPNRMTFACALADRDPGRKRELTLVVFT